MEARLFRRERRPGEYGPEAADMLLLRSTVRAMAFHVLWLLSRHLFTSASASMYAARTICFLS